MNGFTWKRVSRNKIVARNKECPMVLIQLTRYKTNRREPKGTWKLRVLSKPFEWGSKMHEHLAVPLAVTAPSEAVAAAEAYIKVAVGMEEGPLHRIAELRFGSVDRVRFIPTPMTNLDGEPSL